MSKAIYRDVTIGEFSLYFPCLSGNQRDRITETGSLQTASTTTPIKAGHLVGVRLFLAQSVDRAT